MDKYKVDDDKIAVIARTFGTDRETVKKMNSLYQGISDGMKYQYLAHVIRTVEEKIRMELHSPLFQIRCIPVDASSPLPGFGSAQYFENDCYLIFGVSDDLKIARNSSTAFPPSIASIGNLISFSIQS